MPQSPVTNCVWVIGRESGISLGTVTPGLGPDERRRRRGCVVLMVAKQGSVQGPRLGSSMGYVLPSRAARLNDKGRRTGSSILGR